MASEIVTLTAVCSGGNHLTITGSGAKALTVIVHMDDLSTPVTNDEAEAFVKVIAKLAKAGRTVAQAKTLLQAGVTVTV